MYTSLQAGTEGYIAIELLRALEGMSVFSGSDGMSQCKYMSFNFFFEKHSV